MMVLRRLFLTATILALTPALGRAAEAPAVVTGAPDPDAGSVIVTAQRLATTSSAGTKTDTPLIQTPQSISVLQSGFIQDLGLQNLDEALRFVAGVTPEQRGASAEVYDLFSLRGFSAPVFLDGLYYVNQSDETGYAAAQADISRLDRIDVIKGPSSALYGKSGPGGLVAEQSRLPLDKSLYGSLAGTYGTFDLYRFDGDVGGRLGDNILWRLYGSANGAHGQQEFGERRRQTLSAAVTLGASTPTTLTLLAAYSHDPRNGDYGVFPAVGTLFPNPRGQISSNFYGGEPGDFYSREQLGLTYILKHDFGNGWALRASGRYQYVRSALGITYTQGPPLDVTEPAPSIYGRASYSTSENNKDYVFDNQLTGHLTTGPLRHDLLFGFDYQKLVFNEHAAFGSATPIDVFNPVYGTMTTPDRPDLVPDGFPFETDTRQRQAGVYAQDQITWGALDVTVSGRHDWAHQSANAAQVQDNDKFTYRAGAIYKTPLGVAPYVTYSTSFQPQAAQLVGGGLADPSLGKQIEGGVKYQTSALPLTLSAAYFHIEQTNVLSYDPVSFAATQSGKVRSRGVEVEAQAQLPYGFDGRLAFSRQSVKILQDQDPNNVGNGPPTVGRGGVSANLEWAPRSGLLRGFAIGGDVRHVDRVYAYGLNDSPSYTLVDALMRYDLGAYDPRLRGLQLSINANNIGNDRYLTGCYVNYSWCWYGARRTVEGTIRYSF